MMKIITAIIFITAICGCSGIKEYHVSIDGNDSNNGSESKPFRTIMAAARVAQPGDVITVYEGTYRELIAPPRGGISDEKRITYRAAEGETVIIKGSEEIKDWIHVKNDVWKVVLPNHFFGNYNPYQDSIWGDWFNPKGQKHHTGEVYLNGLSMYEMDSLHKLIHPNPYISRRDPQGSTLFWFCESNDENTSIYANFNGANPNNELVEINARKACFYPDSNYINYITIQGFHMTQAATNWAAPTAEQVGLIGTNWSKGWIIENNTISNSRCVAITLGKDRATGHNVWTLNPEKDGAWLYVDVINKALKRGWNKDTIGSHMVRNNVIFDCEVAGICGSLGAIFSTIEGNHIYNIFNKRQFDGAEKGGIKLHAAIDVLIKNNHIHNTYEGIWLDWMAQGTRITGNLLYNNDKEDFFTEVDHGPYLVDNNIFLSPVAIWDWSSGGTFVHNLIGGRINCLPQGRETPYFKAHTTELVEVKKIELGDTRYYNNIFAPKDTNDTDYLFVHEHWGPLDYSLNVYENNIELPMFIESNVYYQGTRPYQDEKNSLYLNEFNANIKVINQDGETILSVEYPQEILNMNNPLITTDFLGKTIITGGYFENPDGTPITVDTDYLGNKRNLNNPIPGPFEIDASGLVKIKIWR
jgi:hypothetical protein